MTNKEREKIIVVAAHPDDELLWAWPIMQRLDLFEPLVLFGCGNRQKGKGPYEAALAQGSVCGEDDHYRVWFASDGPSNFALLPGRSDQSITLREYAYEFRHWLQTACDTFETADVWVHNPWGEYGHRDHRLLWELTVTTPDINEVWFSDICLENKSHISYPEPPFVWGQWLYWLKNEGAREKRGGDEWEKYLLDGACNLDVDWLAGGRAVYEAYRAWSWDNPIPEQCNVYRYQL